MHYTSNIRLNKIKAFRIFFFWKKIIKRIYFPRKVSFNLHNNGNTNVLYENNYNNSGKTFPGCVFFVENFNNFPDQN